MKKTFLFFVVAHREAFENERLRNTEDMRSLEGQLNDIRREHAKAVAALKNAERKVMREKQLKNVEKERNLLMVKIREEKKTVSRLPLTGNQILV